jgi:hypothetical protein
VYLNAASQGTAPKAGVVDAAVAMAFH